MHDSVSQLPTPSASARFPGAKVMPRHRRAASLPVIGFLREPEVLLARSTQPFDAMAARESSANFRNRLRLGGSRSRAVAWRRADVEGWLDGLTVIPTYSESEAGE